MIGGFVYMSQLKLRELGMDAMERLYYERKEVRQRAYAAKRRKNSTIKKEIVSKKPRKEQHPNNFGMILKEVI